MSHLQYFKMSHASIIGKCPMQHIFISGNSCQNVLHESPCSWNFKRFDDFFVPITFPLFIFTHFYFLTLHRKVVLCLHYESYTPVIPKTLNELGWKWIMKYWHDSSDPLVCQRSHRHKVLRGRWPNPLLLSNSQANNLIFICNNRE